MLVDIWHEKGEESWMTKSKTDFDDFYEVPMHVWGSVLGVD
jgi:hypothetical protein